MRNKALAAIEHYQMFAQGAVLLVALSGGADSVALLHFLRTLREERSLTLEALHLNHNLRGAESDADEAFVRALCRGWQIPLTVESADVTARAKQAGESIEAAARHCRYAFFEREARRRDAKVATAHTASDSAETVLINLLRGTALRGLTGIAPVRGRYIRPLIDCTRDEIEAYCAGQGLAFVTDSTNHSDAHTRNRIRRQIIPLLERENPRLAESLTRMTRLLRQDADHLDAQAQAALESLSKPEGSVDRAGFLALPAAVGGRALTRLIRQEGVEADSHTVQSLLGMIEQGSGVRQLSARVMFRCQEKAFRLEPVAVPPPFFSVEVSGRQMEQSWAASVFDGKTVKLRVEGKKNSGKSQIIHQKALTYRLDYDRMGKIAILRQRLPSDRLRVPGRGCSKTLKNLFQEQRVAAAERLRRVVLESGGEILWVEGLGPSQDAAVNHATKRILIIEITEGIHERGYLKGLD